MSAATASELACIEATCLLLFSSGLLSDFQSLRHCTRQHEEKPIYAAALAGTALIVAPGDTPRRFQARDASIRQLLTECASFSLELLQVALAFSIFTP